MTGHYYEMYRMTLTVYKNKMGWILSEVLNYVGFENGYWKWITSPMLRYIFNSSSPTWD